MTYSSEYSTKKKMNWIPVDHTRTQAELIEKLGKNWCGYQIAKNKSEIFCFEICHGIVMRGATI